MVHTVFEVALCGHATLASAHVLWEDGHVPATQQVRFHTKSRLLTGDRVGEWIELDFPAKREEPAPAPAGLAEAARRDAEVRRKDQFDYLVEIDGAYQASPRGGGVRVRVVGDRVKLGGKAVTVLRGELLAG